MKKLSKLSLKAFRIKEASNNFAFFANYYFSHYTKKPNSELHFYLYSYLSEAVDSPNGNRFALAAPRSNAKSSVSSLFLPLWCLLFKKKKFIVLISDSSTQANDLLSNVRRELEDNEKIKEDFGSLVGEIWRNDDIVASNGVRVLALGARKKIRGRRHGEARPDLIILDDIENDENVSSAEQRRKNENWFFKAVSKAGDVNTDVFVVGTILHYNSLLATLLSNPTYDRKKFKAVKSFSESRKWQTWESVYLNKGKKEAKKFFVSNKKEMLQGTEVLWPEGQPYYALMEARLSEGPGAFDSEYQNEPINPDECLFQEDWFKFIDPDWSNYVEIVGACDPSMGGSQNADFSAIIYLGKNKEGFLDVLVADIERRHPDKIKDDILQTACFIRERTSAPIRAFGIEKVQFQEYFKHVVDKESREKGIYLPIRETENQTTKKQIRIQTLQPLIKNGIIRFQNNQKELLEEMRFYPKAEHDDGPDCLEMAVRLARTPTLTSQKY